MPPGEYKNPQMDWYRTQCVPIDPGNEALRSEKLHDDCPVCGCGVKRDRAAAILLAAKEQNGRLRYYRERDRLLAELRDRGFEANVTLDGSVIITGCQP